MKYVAGAGRISYPEVAFYNDGKSDRNVFGIIRFGVTS
jgi:hypothetical protein